MWRGKGGLWWGARTLPITVRYLISWHFWRVRSLQRLIYLIMASMLPVENVLFFNNPSTRDLLARNMAEMMHSWLGTAVVYCHLTASLSSLWVQNDQRITPRACPALSLDFLTSLTYRRLVTRVDLSIPCQESECWRLERSCRVHSTSSANSNVSIKCLS